MPGQEDKSGSYKGARLDSADFSGRDLAGADFRGASLVGASFQGANLAGAALRGADVKDADFTGANMDGADLANVRNGDTAIWPIGFLFSPPPILPKTAQTEEERLLCVYFDADGRLEEIPVGQMRQRVVMTRIAEAFERGVRFPEKEVNERLKRFHSDFATLRRYLVDHRLMTRERNIYWRTEAERI